MSNGREEWKDYRTDTTLRLQFSSWNIWLYKNGQGSDSALDFGSFWKRRENRCVVRVRLLRLAYIFSHEQQLCLWLLYETNLTALLLNKVDFLVFTDSFFPSCPWTNSTRHSYNVHFLSQYRFLSRGIRLLFFFLRIINVKDICDRLFSLKFLCLGVCLIFEFDLQWRIFCLDMRVVPSFQLSDVGFVYQVTVEPKLCLYYKCQLPSDWVSCLYIWL